MVGQLRRAVAFDKAVEQGRSEERARIAHDLHDHIGARLLTLIYKAQSPEMEEYVRHTLQDLKTLTRGLAAANHSLSHAAAEWKADLSQRLTAAHVQIDWPFDADKEIMLSVVQWSALTRVLRELVSNTIAHAQATRVEVSLVLRKDRLDLQIQDNGEGRNPRAWAHGLGLGGVRKRVKQLGGEVEWRELQPRGITYSIICPLPCIVNIPDTNVKNALLANNLINTNADGEIQCSEAAAYYGAISVPNLSISDLTGIEAFTNIYNLNCDNNLLSSLNVSSNTLLTNLICGSNQLSHFGYFEQYASHHI